MALLLGPQAGPTDSARQLECLTHSLNTVFDILNELVGLINATLTGQSFGEETIRHLIGSQLDGRTPQRSLEEYLGQIKTAFLTTHQAFQEAHRSTVAKVLAELDPDKSPAVPSGLAFGPLKKAEAFSSLKERYRTVSDWFVSPRFRDDFLREFEKSARKHFMARDDLS